MQGVGGHFEKKLNKGGVPLKFYEEGWGSENVNVGVGV